VFHTPLWPGGFGPLGEQDVEDLPPTVLIDEDGGLA